MTGGGVLTVDVFPTCVGMNRATILNRSICVSVPHVCGDEPSNDCFLVLGEMCSPRVWG